MRNLIPHFIQEQYLQGNFHGRFEAAILYIDLSGFTPLTETLMKEGTVGAEQLSLILNDIFGLMVKVVYRRGGFIPYFAGDAITALFPDSIDLPATDLLGIAQSLDQHFAQKGLQKTKFGDFQIRIKIRLSHGWVKWGIVGGAQHKAFYFRGKAIDQATRAEIVSKAQGVVFHQAFYENLPASPILQTEKLPSQYHRLLEAPATTSTPKVKKNRPTPLQKEVLRQFLPPSILEFNQQGEFREVISIFITFTGVKQHRALNNFASTVLDITDRFSGYFKEIDFGDKGGMMVVFFGAPVSYENNAARALEFITTLKAETQQLQANSDLQFRAGISAGLAYAGIIGAKERCQYAAVGNRVNLAARLMTQAAWGSIRVDEEIADTKNFRFTLIGDTPYKGIENNIPTYELVGRAQEEQLVFSGIMVGREEEFQQLLAFAQPIFQQRFAGIAYLHGEAGIGKSRLSYELKKALLQQGNIRWLHCTADQILRKPFNPFTGFLKDYFQQIPDNTPEVNLANFEQQYEHLLSRLAKLQHPEAELTHKELRRTQSILAAMVGIAYKKSLWSQLDAKGRYQNTLLALSALFTAESLLQPTVIVLEDGHWFDKSSIEFLKKFTARLRQYPIFILISSRYLDDGSKVQLIPKEELKRQHVPILQIELETLPPESLQHFVESKLGSEVSPNLLELLQRSTNGNPFYLEQILEYFVESQLLENKEGAWTITDPNVVVSGSINAILMARVDRLSNLVKETVKAAAVIGHEFEIPVLTEIMKTHRDFAQYNGNSTGVLRQQIQSAEKVQIWLAMNELRYIFRHSLLREAVYHMQMGTRLKELHGLIAEAIERLYAPNLKEKYIDLAFHYEQAERSGKTRKYLAKAATHARRNYQNEQALQFYDKLLHYVRKKKKKRVKVLLDKAKILQLTGAWDDCEQVLQEALQLSIKSDKTLLIGRCHNRIGKLYMLRGEYPKAQQHFEAALQKFQSLPDEIGTAKVYGNLGNFYFRQGNYPKAKDFFNRSLAYSQSPLLINSRANIVSHLGLAYMNQGQFEEGIRCQLEELEQCQQRNDKQGLATLYTNLGIVYFEKGAYPEALDCYEQGLSISEELGNKQLTAIAIGCIGSVQQQQGNYPAALENFLTDLRICEEIGDKQGIAIALGLLGELRALEGEFDLAKKYLETALQHNQTLNYRKGIAKAVNNLGDIYTFEKDYAKALHYYDRAIQVSRKINNQLVLGFSLVEKSEVLEKMERYDAAQEIQAEVNTIAQALGNPELLFQARLLTARLQYHFQNTEKTLEILHSLLKKEPSEEEAADIHFTFCQLFPEEGQHRPRALQLYQKLYRATPKYRYQERIELLSLQ